MSASSGGLDEASGIETLRAISDAATPGEWEAHGCRIDLGGEGTIYDEGGHSEEDADLIVAAVNYVRAALAEALKGKPR